MSNDLNKMFREASELAERYNWPDEAKQLRQGVVPEGFGREVDKTEEERRAHAKQLARLRVLIVKISIAKRAELCYNS